jgi:hypothetical protein
VDAIALLDSDDVSESTHLRYAAEPLSRGADFFFANSRIESEQIDYFREHPLLEQLYGSPPVAEGLARWSGGLAALLTVSGHDRELMQSAIPASRSAALYSALHLLRRRDNIAREVL